MTKARIGCWVVSNTEVRNSLFFDRDGNEVGLDEVSYIENPSEERILTLDHVLSCPWHTEVHRISAASLLAGWGNDSALLYASLGLSAYKPEAGVVSENRLGRYDDFPDVLAEIVVLHAEATGVDDRHLCILDWVLSMYHLFPMYSRFPHSLARLDVRRLNKSLRAAIRSTLDQSDPIRAGWLLKAASRADATSFFEFEPKIRSARLDRDIVFSVLGAAAAVGQDTLNEIVRRYASFEDATVREAVVDWKKMEATLGRILDGH